MNLKNWLHLEVSELCSWLNGETLKLRRRGKHWQPVKAQNFQENNSSLGLSHIGLQLYSEEWRWWTVNFRLNKISSPITSISMKRIVLSSWNRNTNQAQTAFDIHCFYSPGFTPRLPSPPPSPNSRWPTTLVSEVINV